MFRLLCVFGMAFQWALLIQAQTQFDILITGAKIIDGSGNPAFDGDLAIKGDTIAALGRIPNATAEIVLDARGLVVAPGFIDTDMTGDLPDEVKGAILARIPQGRMGTADEVADVVTFLATRGSYVNGVVLHVNGGMYGG